MTIILCPHLESIIQKPIVKESVREEEIATNNGKVEKFAEHKSTKIDVVSETEDHVCSIIIWYYAFPLFLHYVCSLPLTCYEYFCRKTGPASPFSHPDPQWTWPWFLSWRASLVRPPSWARCSAADRKRRRGRWGTGGPTGSTNCTQCSQTSHPKSICHYLIDSWK